MRTPHAAQLDPGERDLSIDDTLAGIAGYLGCKPEPDWPRWGLPELGQRPSLEGCRASCHAL